MPSYKEFGYDKHTLLKINSCMTASRIISLYLSLQHKFHSKSQLDITAISKMDTLNGYWHSSFDILFSEYCNHASFASTINKLGKLSLQLDTPYVASQMPYCLHKLSVSQLELSDLVILIKFIEICSNPVQLYLQPHSTPIISKFRSFLENIFQTVSFCPPILLRAVTRFYEDSIELNSAYCAINSVIQHEFPCDSINIDLPFIMYAFGHQCFYLDLIAKYNIVFHTNYPITVDPQYVSNLSLLKSQCSTYSNIKLVSLSSCYPSLYRSYPSKAILSVLLNHSSNNLNLSESFGNTNIAMVNKKYNFSDSPLRFPKTSNSNVSPKISTFVLENPLYICFSWRSDHYKSESSRFNYHRNSNPTSIYYALRKLAYSIDVPIFIMNTIDMYSEKQIADFPPNIHYCLDFSTMSGIDFMHLISNSSCFLTGPAGSSFVANLFDIPTLVFDIPPISLTAFNPYRFYLYSNISTIGSTIHESELDIHSLPHNGILLDKLGISIRQLSGSELFRSFLIFVSLIEQYYASLDSDFISIDQYLVDQIPSFSPIQHSR